MWVAPRTPPAGPETSIVTGFSAAFALVTMPPFDCMIRNGTGPERSRMLRSAWPR